MSNEQLFDFPIIVFSGVIISLVFFILGLLISRYKCYGLIAGYNRAPKHIKKEYDIEGLADHVGNGLITLSVLLIISAVLFYFELQGWFYTSMSLFVLIAAIIPLGAPKFMPEEQRLIKAGSADAKHPVLRRMLSTASYKSLEQQTRKWIQVCGKCGHKKDFWEAGGVRGGGVGEPGKLQYCESCAKLSMHRIRKKTAQELIKP